MSVAKPWMLASPAPLTSHSLGRLPVLVFSQATGLVTGASHGAADTTGTVWRGRRGSSTPAASRSRAAHAMGVALIRPRNSLRVRRFTVDRPLVSVAVCAVPAEGLYPGKIARGCAPPIRTPRPTAWTAPVEAGLTGCGHGVDV